MTMTMTSIVTRCRLLLVGVSVVALKTVLAIDAIPADTVFCDERHVDVDGSCVWLQPQDPTDNTTSCPEFKVEYESIEHYLNPDIFNDPKHLADIAESLQNGELVVIRNAFRQEFAEAMHCDLDSMPSWPLHTKFLNDGFHYHHHNIYNEEDFSKLMNETYDMFGHSDSKRWMENLSQRDCSGQRSASASYYMPGDHSLPHTDHIGQRTVAYVWHLSKNWQPEWGGALYWAPEWNHHSYLHASFNTLSLFTVHADTPHFVTTVSRHAQEKRLSFNGWFTSSWFPSAEDDLESLLSTPEQRWDLTSDQIDLLQEMIDNKNNEMLDEERRRRLIDLMDMVEDEVSPPYMMRKFEIDAV